MSIKPKQREIATAYFCSNKSGEAKLTIDIKETKKYDTYVMATLDQLEDGICSQDFVHKDTPIRVQEGVYIWLWGKDEEVDGEYIQLKIYEE